MLTRHRTLIVIPVIISLLMLAACGTDTEYVYHDPDAGNRAPIANAGANFTVDLDEPAVLNASESTDADGDALTYAWSFIYNPSRSLARLTNSAAAKPSFTPDVNGVYVLALTVSDGSMASADYVTVTTTAFTPAPSYYVGQDLTGADFSDADLRYELFFGAELGGADFSNAVLYGANFGGANLALANLTRADLSNAKLTDAILTDVTWSNTTCPDGTNSNTSTPQTCIGHGI